MMHALTSNPPVIWRKPRKQFRNIAALFGFTILLSSLTGCSQEVVTAPNDNEEFSRVSVALDWEVNTNHLGIYLAEALGYFADAGIIVQIVPYQGVAVPDMIRNGSTDFGVADQTAVQIKRSLGYPIQTVMAITQTETGRIVYRTEHEDIQRPSDLDGLIFGGFDSPVYASIAQAVIEGDGGVGEFTEVTMNMSTYDGLASGEIDFTLSVATWEDLLAEMEGRPYGVFRYQDYGMPDVQTLGLISSDDYLAEHPDRSRAFVQAVQAGYEYAVKYPEHAAEILLEAEPEILAPVRELVFASTKLMTEEYFVVPGRVIGELDPNIWSSYGGFLYERGLITDAQGNILEQEPDWEQYFTNSYLK